MSDEIKTLTARVKELEGYNVNLADREVELEKMLTEKYGGSKYIQERHVNAVELRDAALEDAEYHQKENKALKETIEELEGDLELEKGFAKQSYKEYETTLEENKILKAELANDPMADLWERNQKYKIALEEISKEPESCTISIRLAGIAQGALKNKAAEKK